MFGFFVRLKFFVFKWFVLLSVTLLYNQRNHATMFIWLHGKALYIPSMIWVLTLMWETPRAAKTILFSLSGCFTLFDFGINFGFVSLASQTWTDGAIESFAHEILTVVPERWVCFLLPKLRMTADIFLVIFLWNSCKRNVGGKFPVFVVKFSLGTWQFRWFPGKETLNMLAFPNASA